MSSTLLLSLAGLALLDSTSIGTLFIPIWLMLAPGRVRAGRILVYLGTIAVFYFAVGVLILLGADSIAGWADGALDSPVALWIQLGIGVSLFAVSFRFDSKRRKPGTGVARWRERVTAGTGSAGWLAGLALLAALAEVATMLPYLGAIGMMTTSNLGLTTVLGLLAAYCVVMVLPAVILLAGRLAARSLIEPLLQRLNKWITDKAGNATGWILGIAGFLVARDALSRLFA
ncbi:GAP family protein [Micromonospora sp. CPCC 205371]|nr:GAP family protein [Micromonospora sp. CPCC 205371]